MSMSYHADDTVLRIVFNGRHTVREEVAILTEAVRADGFRAGTNLLLDVTSWEPDRSQEEIMELARCLGGLRRPRHLVRTGRAQRRAIPRRPVGRRLDSDTTGLSPGAEPDT